MLVKKGMKFTGHSGKKGQSEYLKVLYSNDYMIFMAF
jgi:hypothetical protein